MATVTHRFRGDEYNRRLLHRAFSAMTSATLVVSREAQRLVTQHMSITDDRGRWVSGSKPGEPPHVFTGDLSRSFVTDVVIDGGDIVGEVGNTAIYARALEEGFEPRNLKARPYLRPAMDSEGPAVRRMLEEAVRDD